MKLDGVEGESAVEGVSGFMELDSCSFGADSSRSQDSGGSASRGVRFTEVSCTKQTDTATPQLIRMLITGRTGAVDIRFVRTGPNNKPTTFLKLQLDNATVASLGTTGSGDRPVDSFTLTFAKIAMDAFGIGDDLSGVPVSFDFDVFAHQ